MVNFKVTFIPSDGTPAKDYQFDNFDITGVSGAKLRELLAEKVNVATGTSIIRFLDILE